MPAFAGMTIKDTHMTIKAQTKAEACHYLVSTVSAFWN
jgi:hypothetical protein